MSNILKYLNSPQLVYKIQNAFGVERIESKNKGDQQFRVKNKFFNYLFIIGTELGDALFYGIFIPFFFFNLDGFIARRFVFMWFVNMYIGQALKEFFLEKRPSYPAIQMQKKWSNEYSMPSTHAMSSPSIGVTIVYFALQRYEVDFFLCAVLTLIWISIVSWSRVYLGMHSVLDLLLGFALSGVILTFMLPITNSIEIFFATHILSPLVLIPLTAYLMYFFPATKQFWTPTKSDTTSIAGVFLGIEFGHWLNYQLNYLSDSNVTFPLSLDIDSFYYLILRTVIGLLIVAGSEFIGKLFFHSILCISLGEDSKTIKSQENSVDNVKKNFIELTTNLLTYSFLGFNTLFIAAQVFKHFGIERASFYTEI